jgi:hypothetical protein
MLDDELLEEYIYGFYGYGSYRAPYWFVGMEEGGGGSEESMARRLDLWAQRGRPELEDLADYQKALGVTRYTGRNARIQRTWGPLIRVLMGIQGTDASREAVRAYQRDRWARAGGEVCIPELLPLPSPSAGEWAYGDSSNLPQLRTRDAYRAHYASARARHLRSRVLEHKPAVAVFYGSGYLRWWPEIAVAPFRSATVGKKRIHTAHDGETLFVAVNHVVTRGTGSDYLEQLGRLIAAGQAPPPGADV